MVVVIWKYQSLQNPVILTGIFARLSTHFKILVQKGNFESTPCAIIWEFLKLWVY
jgi:hypothetical protein